MEEDKEEVKGNKRDAPDTVGEVSSRKRGGPEKKAGTVSIEDALEKLEQLARVTEREAFNTIGVEFTQKTMVKSFARCIFNNIRAGEQTFSNACVQILNIPFKMFADNAKAGIRAEVRFLKEGVNVVASQRACKNMCDDIAQVVLRGPDNTRAIELREKFTHLLAKSSQQLNLFRYYFKETVAERELIIVIGKALEHISSLTPDSRLLINDGLPVDILKPEIVSRDIESFDYMYKRVWEWFTYANVYSGYDLTIFDAELNANYSEIEWGKTGQNAFKCAGVCFEASIQRFSANLLNQIRVIKHLCEARLSGTLTVQGAISWITGGVELPIVQSKVNLIKTAMLRVVKKAKVPVTMEAVYANYSRLTVGGLLEEDVDMSTDDIKQIVQKAGDDAMTEFDGLTKKPQLLPDVDELAKAYYQLSKKMKRSKEKAKRVKANETREQGIRGGLPVESFSDLNKSIRELVINRFDVMKRFEDEKIQSLIAKKPRDNDIPTVDTEGVLEIPLMGLNTVALLTNRSSADLFVGTVTESIARYISKMQELHAMEKVEGVILEFQYYNELKDKKKKVSGGRISVGVLIPDHWERPDYIETVKKEVERMIYSVLKAFAEPEPFNSDANLLEVKQYEHNTSSLELQDNSVTTSLFALRVHRTSLEDAYMVNMTSVATASGYRYHDQNKELLFFTYPPYIADAIAEKGIVERPVAHFSTVKEIHKKVSKMIEGKEIMHAGICIYEVYYMIKNDITSNCISTLQERTDYASTLLKILRTEEANLMSIVCAGDIKGFIDYVYEKRKEVFVLYNYYTKSFYCPDESSQHQYKYCFLYFDAHVYMSSVNSITIFYFNSPDALEYTDLNALSSAIAAKVEKKKKFSKNFVLEEDKAKSELNHIHWSIDIETSSDEKGNQKPYLVVVTKISDNKTTEFLDMESASALSELDTGFRFFGTNCLEKLFFLFVSVLHSYTKYGYRHCIWSYNGSGFDYLFICKAFERFMPLKIKGSTNRIKAFNVGSTVTFLDVACWYPPVPCVKNGEVLKGLEALACSAGVDMRKIKFDVRVSNSDIQKLQSKQENGLLEEEEEKWIKDVTDYCEQDTKLVGAIVKVLVINSFEKFTIGDKENRLGSKYPCSSAAVALHVFRRFFIGDKSMEATEDLMVLEKERESYHGGISLGFRTSAEQINVYDICSSYPSSMMGVMPAKYTESYKFVPDLCINAKFVNNSRLKDTYLYRITSFKFPAEVKVPTILCHYKNAGNIMPLEWSGPPTGIWGVELRLALELGATFTLQEIMKYEADEYFQKYVLYFYEQKSKAKKEKNAGMALFYKLMLNSLYGKFGQRMFKKFSVGHPGILASEIVESGIHTVEDMRMTASGSMKIVWNTQDKPNTRIGGLVRISSYIAAKSRVRLLSALYEKDAKGDMAVNHLVYVDTDSIFTCDGYQLTEKLTTTSSELGKFTKEDKSCDKIWVLGSKNYIMVDKNNKVKAMATKGVNQRFIDKEEYLKAESAGQQYDANIEIFLRDFGNVRVTKMIRSIVPTFELKRKIVGDATISLPYKNEEEFDALYIKKKTEEHDKTEMLALDSEENKKIVALYRKVMIDHDPAAMKELNEICQGKSGYEETSKKVIEAVFRCNELAENHGVDLTTSTTIKYAYALSKQLNRYYALP